MLVPSNAAADELLVPKRMDVAPVVDAGPLPADPEHPLRLAGHDELTCDFAKSWKIYIILLLSFFFVEPDAHGRWGRTGTVFRRIACCVSF